MLSLKPCVSFGMEGSDNFTLDFTRYFGASNSLYFNVLSIRLHQVGTSGYKSYMFEQSAQVMLGLGDPMQFEAATRVPNPTISGGDLDLSSLTGVLGDVWYDLPPVNL